MRVYYISLIGSLLFSQAVPDTWVDSITRLGATGVLGVALLLMLSQTIPKMAKEFRDTLEAICLRHDTWERVRHEDQLRMERLIGEMERKG